jgi:hypothetical protein
MCRTLTVRNADTMGPEATEINASLWELGVSEKEPEAENWLRKNIENGVGDNLLVHGKNARSVGYTPDAVVVLE